MKSRVTVVAGVLLAVAAAAAQADAGSISTIKVTPTPAKAGEAVTIVIETDGTAPTFCGMTVDFGDASGRDLKIDSGKDDFQFPVTLTKVYAQPGSYKISAQGRKVTSHFPCMGAAEATVVVEGKPAVGSAPSCPEGWKAKGKVGKAGDFACKAGKGAKAPEKVLACREGLEYFQTKSTLGCRKAKK